MRPHQWSKNLAIFLGILFARRILDLTAVKHVLMLFAAFCALSSATYLVNDILDREEDARHPTKRLRPIASGKLSVRTAGAAAAGLLVVAFALAFAIPPI